MNAPALDITLTTSVRNHLKYAVYLPAIQPQYAQGVVKTNYTQQMPCNLSVSDLNYFNPMSKLFSLQAALYSAGNFNNHSNMPPCMVTTRERSENQNTVVLGDSGGYQVATGKLTVTPKKREELFQWLICYCDASMTLDIPVWALDKGTMRGYNNFSDCLCATLEHLDAFVDMGARNHRFLNVLHGRTRDESDVWYEAVKGYGLYGWAIGGGITSPSGRGDNASFSDMLRRILIMLGDGMFDRDQVWIHFLGVGDLKTALLLTTLKNTLNNLLTTCAVEITYDTSSPSQTARFLSGYCLPTISPFSLAYGKKVIDKELWADNTELLPFKASTISQYAYKGDIILETLGGEYIPRELAYLILENNNVEAMVCSIDAAHQLLNSDLTRDQLNQIFPYHLLDAQDAIEKVLKQKTLIKAQEVLMSPITQLHLGNAYKNVKRIIH